MGPKNDNEKNIFYTDLTGSFRKICATYSCYGSLDAPHHDNVHVQEEELDLDELEHLVPFINLASDNTANDADNADFIDEPTDAWMSNAVRLYNSIQQITSLLNTNASSYTHKDIILQATTDLRGQNRQLSEMSEDEVAIFESSIASFMTSTARQIDTLRQSLEETNTSTSLSEDVNMHKSGILSHLVSELKEIMKEFQSMQQMRHREELELYHEPLKCIFHQSRDEMDDLLDITLDGGMENDYEPDEDFLNGLERDEETFQALFSMDDDQELQQIVEEPLPSFPMLNAKHQTEEQSQTNTGVPTIPANERFPVQIPSMNQDGEFNKAQRNNEEASRARPMMTIPTEEESSKNQCAILQQEQVFLTAAVQNTKLDAAQKVESQMMQITSLLSQFSALISEQQEEIQVIADSTKASRQNVNKGREKLVKATEQRKKKRHYFAWVIFIMGVLLLFLNAVIA